MVMLDLKTQLSVIKKVIGIHFSSGNFILDEIGSVRCAFISVEKDKYSLSLFYNDKTIFCSNSGLESTVHARAIQKAKAPALMGDRESLEYLREYLKIKNEEFSYLERYNRNNGQWVVGAGVRILNNEDDFASMYEILSQHDIYDFIKRMRKKDFVDLQMKDIESGHQKSYGLFRGTDMMSCATMRPNKSSCMLTGVATDVDHSGEGFATELVSKICYDYSKRGYEIYLFYLNPEAGSVYKNSGFENLAVWTTFTLE